MEPEVLVVFWAVVLARFVVPLLIPVFPLPAIIACLVLDAVDQTVFQFFGYDPPGYQSYDKAMDVYYLAVAWVTTLRNWTSPGAVAVARFLFFYRMVGVLLFELLGIRALLLLFPNTFEYFFIAYEAIRTRWDPSRFGLRFWVVVAAVIWIVVKLPQEAWIHVFQLDFTDAVRDVAWFGPLVVVGLLGGCAAFWYLVRPRLDPADHTTRLVAEPLPVEMDEAHERDAWIREHGRVWSGETMEKVVQIGLMSVIFSQILPGLDASVLQVFVGVGLFVVINSAWTILLARHALGRDSLWTTAILRLTFNLVLAVVLEWLLGREGGSMNTGHTVFFVVLLTTMIVLHDRFRPVAGFRFSTSAPRSADAERP